ncbi:26S protease regulatory subunit 8 like protein [Fusarium oxysporum f. sp. cubense race 1]|uniref:26S proteasome regulatory subunit 8 homolog n=1 Tax=Fusarium oxysporum f. sp. cubense (strain race 1) TaxID=1229664 RepID=N4UV20_FUSC1|nr:26S protease regulatory subunit 8 like protein [Fusarium oxysporum f. sp. cubense race 1]
MSLASTPKRSSVSQWGTHTYPTPVVARTTAQHNADLGGQLPPAWPVHSFALEDYETSCSLVIELQPHRKPSPTHPRHALLSPPPPRTRESGNSCQNLHIYTPEQYLSARFPDVKGASPNMALDEYYHNKIEAMKLEILKGQAALRRLEAQRNDYNSRVRLLREELGLLQQPGSYVGEVVKVMSTKKILVKVHPEGKYVVDVSDSVDIGKLTPGKRVTLLSDSYKLEKMLPSSVDPLVSLMMVEKVPDSTYDMIGGLDQQIKEIKEVIELGLKHPELFESLGIAQPKGVLLYGPPGTGKTLLARAVAHHTACKFIRVSGSELVQKYIGEGSRMVRELFVMAREHAPSIIFMDEIDSIGSSRVEGSSGGDSEVQRTMLELLNQLDGFEPTKNIKVIMATNRLDILDPALLRPGRIDRKIEFPPPSVEARADILRIHSRKMNLTRGINLTKIAEKMNGCSGAELKGVCTEAGMYALRERRVHVTQEDFELATAKILNKHDDKEVSLGKLWK